MRDDEMNEGIRKMLEKMSKKDYSDEELRDAEDTANSKYRSKLDAPVWDKVRLMFEVVKHPFDLGTSASCPGRCGCHLSCLSDRCRS